MNNMLRDSHVQASLYLVRAASLKDRPDHSQSTSFPCFLEVWTVESTETLCDWDQLIVVSSCAVHRDQEAQGQLIHLL